MRLGQNPAKFVDHVAQPQPVSVAVISYVPFLSGYYAQGLEVLKACLGSLWQNTPEPYDLLLFDNASCPEVREYLLESQAQGRIQYLVLSDRNVGKAGAWNFLLAAAPGEYVAYADGDVYFHPGWLSAQLEVLREVPGVGMVTGMPVRNPEKYSGSTLRWAAQEPEARLERGRLMPWEDFWKHVRSLGLEEGEARRIYEEGEDVCLFYRGRKYYVGAGHFQFVAPGRVLREVLPIPSRRPMGEVRLLDVAIDERGYLRLALPEFRVQHLGNVLEPPERETKTGLEWARPGQGERRKRGLLRRLLLWVHRRSFEALYRD